MEKFEMPSRDCVTKSMYLISNAYVIPQHDAFFFTASVKLRPAAPAIPFNF
jgi:hypothetical protein